MRKFLSIGIILIVVGCNIYDFNPQKQDFFWEDHSLIAHAGGAIDGYTYTNSKEAFMNSYANDFRVFEFDLSLTSDNVLVARHGWDESYGQDFEVTNNPIPYKEFMKLPYYSTYTPLDFDDILHLMKRYPDIYVIMDGKVGSIEDTEELYRKISEHTKNLDNNTKSRLIPQMFYKGDVEIIRNYGFENLLYVVGREEYTPESLAEFCKNNNINMISLSYNRANLDLINVLKKNNIKIYMYTLNDLNEMEKYLQYGVDGFFTDYIQPKDLQFK